MPMFVLACQIATGSFFPSSTNCHFPLLVSLSQLKRKTTFSSRCFVGVGSMQWQWHYAAFYGGNIAVGNDGDGLLFTSDLGRHLHANSPLRPVQLCNKLLPLSFFLLNLMMPTSLFSPKTRHFSPWFNESAQIILTRPHLPHFCTFLSYLSNFSCTFLRSLRKINLFGRIWFFTFPPSIFPFKMTWFDFFLNQGCAAHK